MSLQKFRQNAFNISRSPLGLVRECQRQVGKADGASLLQEAIQDKADPVPNSPNHGKGDQPEEEQDRP